MTNGRRARRIDAPVGEYEGAVEGRLPNFFMVGAPKAGTSSLYHYLVQHPGVFMSDPKEPHFFYNRESPGKSVLPESKRQAPLGKASRWNLANHSSTLSDYLRLFERAAEDQMAGEASTSYMWLPNAAQEIKTLQPQAKIIVLLRNPVERAYSHYWNQVRDDIEPLTFEEALVEEPKRVREGAWHGLYYVDNGLYAGQLERYLEIFGEGSVRVYLFEDLTRDAGEVCRDAFDFLGVHSGAAVDAGRVYNPGGAPRSRLFARLLRSPVKEPLKRVLPTALRKKLGNRIRATNNKTVPKMRPETEARLREVFRDDVARLEAIIGRDLGHWRDGRSSPKG